MSLAMPRLSPTFAFSWFVVAAGLAAVVEFLLLRVALRFGAVLPETPQVLALSRWAIVMGSTALNVSVLACLAVLFLGLGTGGPREPWAAATCLLPLAAAALSPLLPSTGAQGTGWPGWFGGPGGLLISTAAAAGFVLLVLARAGQLPRRRRLLVVAAGLALLAVQYGQAVPAAAALGRPLPGGVWPLALAEGLALLTGLAAPVLLRPGFRPQAAVAGIAAFVLVGGLLWFNPWLGRTIAIWTLSFTGYLPLPLYALAAGAVAYTLTACFLPGRIPQARPYILWGTGLLLLALGGLRGNDVYITLLGVTGLMLLALPPWQDGR